MQIAGVRTRRPQSVSIGRGRPARHKEPFIADQRGAIAFETIIVYIFLVSFLLMPLADVAAAGFQYISAWEALRAFGQSIQYNTPPDVTNASSWETTAMAKADPNFPISNFQLLCGDSKAACSASNIVTATGAPAVKYYSYTTSITLKPLVLKSVLCPNSCTYTLPYSERFQ
jgi:hypothetical protein